MNNEAGKILLNINEKVNDIHKIVTSKKDVNININKTQTTQQVNSGTDKSMKNWYGLNVPSYIPDITGKQIYKLNKMGWNINQICAISGYSIEEARKKYDTYVRNNV